MFYEISVNYSGIKFNEFKQEILNARMSGTKC